MNCSKLLQPIIGMTMLMLLLTGCGSSPLTPLSTGPTTAATPTSPTFPPTRNPSNATLTSSSPPASPAPIPASTPTPAPPSSTPPTGTPLSSDAVPTGFELGRLEGPIKVNFIETQLNPHWKTYTREDSLLGGATDILIDEAGRKWIGGTGLNIFDGLAWQTYTRASVYTDHALALARDATGRIWVGYNEPGGLAMFDGQNWHQYSIAWGEPGNFVHDMAVDRAGRLWFGTAHGLGMFDGQTWTIYRAPPPEGENPVPRPTLEPPAHAPYIEPKVTEFGPDELAYPIAAVAVDRAGQVWVGNTQGLIVYDGQHWRAYPVSGSVADIAVDSATGQVWVATFTEGVSVFDGQSWTHYTQADGLASDGVSAIAIDPAGRKWFVTQNRGVSVFDGHTWVTYTKADGLADNTIWAIAVDPAGHVWLGAGKVLHEFIPAVWSTALPAPISYPTPQIADFTVTPTGALTIGDTISLTWHAQGEKAEICFISGYPVWCQDVPLTGSRTITVDETMLGYAISNVGLRVTASEIFTWSLVVLDFQCLAGDWFFANPSAGCPQAAPVYSRAAAQYFEHGFMIWTEQPDKFYVFFDAGHEFSWYEAPYIFETPEPVETATPPPGYSEPVSGFGRVWRGEIFGLDNVRQRLGWATEPEFAFETAYQCVLPTAYFGDMGICYLRGPSGQALYLYPSSNHREKWFWSEVEPR